MRVNIFLPSYSRVAGGAEKIVIGLANGLVKLGFDVSLHGLKDNRHSSPVYQTSRSVKLFSGIPFFFEFPNFVIKNVSFDSYRLQPADISVVCMTGSIPFMLHLLPFVKKNLIFYEHIGNEFYKKRPIHRIMRKIIARFSRHIVIVAPEISEGLSANQCSKTVVIPNWFAQQDAQKFRETNQFNKLKKNNSFQSKKELLFVGRLEEQKNICVLIQAMALLNEYFSDWNLVIVGSGSLANQTLLMVEELGLGEKIVFAGQVNDVETYYKKSDILLFPSRYESHGLVILEGLSWGLPVVAFRSCWAAGKIIKNFENGILIPGDCSDADAFALGVFLLAHSRIGVSKEKLYIGSCGTWTEESDFIDSWVRLLSGRDRQ